jgi:hypothetical protein
MINKPVSEFKSRELLSHEYAQYGSVRLYDDWIKILKNKVSHLAMLRVPVIQVFIICLFTHKYKGQIFVEQYVKIPCISEGHKFPTIK